MKKHQILSRQGVKIILNFNRLISYFYPLKFYSKSHENYRHWQKLCK